MKLFVTKLCYTYRSEERLVVQQLCGWNVESLNDTQGSATRRAAIALFHLKLRQAIKILNESSQTVPYAMAIAGFTDERTSLWRELALENCHQLTDPYIRAIFAFLTESDNNYETILVSQLHNIQNNIYSFFIKLVMLISDNSHNFFQNEPELSVADRLGFACSFLPDTKLLLFVQELTNEMIKRGNLEAILLTGKD
jgi:hypothetical protein